MDNKRTYIAIAVFFLLFTGWYVVIFKYVKPRHPEWDWTSGQGRSAATEPATEASSSIPSISDATRPSFSEGTRPSTAPSGDLRAIGTAAATSPSGALLGSVSASDPDFRLGVQTSPAGAGLDSVTVNRAKSVDAKEIYTFQQADGLFKDWRSLATQSLSYNGQKVDLADVPWTLESSSATQAVYGVNIVSGKGVPLVRLTKTYELSPAAPHQAKPNPSDGYELNVTYQVRNISQNAATVALEFNGPTMPPREIERSDDRAIVSGYDKGDQLVDSLKDTLSEFRPGTERKDLSKNKNGNLALWAGEASVYFAAIVRPENKGQIGGITAVALNPADPPEDRVVVLQFATADLKVGAGQSVSVPLNVFFGPMDRSMLESSYYLDFPRSYNLLLATSSGICGMCAFPWLVDLLVNVLKFFYLIFRDWGVAIILLVVAVRAILHPIAKKSQVSMLKMQKLAPEMERLKKKFGDDKEGFAKAQMELYKGMGATPLLGCLPMLLQMPIWYALYSALQSEYNLRQAPFLYGLTWIHDLAQPDKVISWPHHVFTLPLLGIRIASLNILPLLMALVMFIQQKTTPQPPATTPEQESQRKMMQWMSLIFAVFFYPAPSGLNLYILTSSTLGIFESKIIRDHVKQKEAEEKQQRVVVDAKQTRNARQKQHDATKPAATGWWARLQQKVEQLRIEAEKRNKRK
jgi:YidC/Oxa1 family membrane protein insertase